MAFQLAARFGWSYVLFFSMLWLAEQIGGNMGISKYSQQSEDFQRIEKAIQYIEANFRSQPTLDQMAQSVHLSKYHFDRLFKRWAGISPMQFMQFMTLEYTKQRLIESKTILETSFDAGLSGPGRLHDLFVTFSGEYQHPTSFRGVNRNRLNRPQWIVRVPKST